MRRFDPRTNEKKESLILGMHPLIHKTVRYVESLLPKSEKVIYTFDDLIMEGFLATCIAYQKYNIKGNYELDKQEFAKYSSWYIRGRLWEILRKRLKRNQLCLIENFTDIGLGDLKDWEYVPMAEREYSIILDKFELFLEKLFRIAKLKKRAEQFCKLYFLEGVSQTMIAEKHKMTRAGISYIINQAIDKMKVVAPRVFRMFLMKDTIP